MSCMFSECNDINLTPLANWKQYKELKEQII